MIFNTTKIDPNREDWGEFDWFFDMVENQISGASNYNNNQWQNNNGGYSYSNINNAADMDMNAQDDGNNQGGTGGVTSSSGLKSCPACTFDNPANAYTCEICGHRF